MDLFQVSDIFEYLLGYMDLVDVSCFLKVCYCTGFVTQKKMICDKIKSKIPEHGILKTYFDFLNYFQTLALVYPNLFFMNRNDFLNICNMPLPEGIKIYFKQEYSTNFKLSYTCTFCRNHDEEKIYCCCCFIYPNW